MAKMRLGTKGKRVAIVAGLRTPFAKQWTAYKELSAADLGRAVVSELLARSEIAPAEIEQVVYGQVVPSVQAPNIAREVVFGTELPASAEAYSVSRACATSYQSTVNVAESIAVGAIGAGLSGGADSSSDVPITVSKALANALVEASKSKTLKDRAAAFLGLKPKDLAPVPPAIAEPSTGLTMGQSAEKMAQENGISRADQDAFAHRSHQLATEAWASGVFDSQVMPMHIAPAFSETLREDNLVRKDSQLEGYAKLRPAFDRRYGTVTAGNASPLTDGASALILMREDKAKALGLEPLGYLRSYAFAAIDPNWQLLMGPAFATPKALERAGISLSDLTLIDMHEAFAAQVLSNTQAFESAEWAEKHLGKKRAIGQIDWDKFNIHGGSISLGHPFAATGARQILQVLHGLKARGGGLGLATACAAGAMGAAMVLETEEV